MADETRRVMQPEQWKWLCSLVATALLTGVGAWFAFGRDAVTQDELALHAVKVEALRESVDALDDTLSKTNILLATHGISFENLRPYDPTSTVDRTDAVEEVDP